MFLRSKFPKFGKMTCNSYKGVSFDVGNGHATYMVIALYKWIEQKARQTDWQKLTLRIMKNGYLNNQLLLDSCSSNWKRPSFIEKSFPKFQPKKQKKFKEFPY